MSSNEPQRGAIGWIDLTVEDAHELADFYRHVVGWGADPVDMGDYQDFNMLSPEDGEPVVGICHARGVNAELPPQWLIYVTVEDVDASAEQCTAMGGEVLVAPRRMGGEARYCVIRDPAGAVVALYAPAR